MTTLTRTALCLSLAGALNGCALIGLEENPDPLIAGPAAYNTQSDSTPLSGPWYQRFDDPALSAQIEAALNDSLTLRQALARLEAARAQAGVSGATLGPDINAIGNTGKVWNEGDAQDTTSQFGANLSWEVDVFGRLSAAAKADQLAAIAAAEDSEAVRLSLAADMASAWYNAVSAQRTLDLLRQQEETDNKLLSLIELREQSGIGTQVEVLQQQSQQALNQSLIPVAESNLRNFENRIDVLAGRMPDGTDTTTPQSGFPDGLLTPPAGVPSDLLLNRPDLRAAKARLVAADADIAGAIADRLPRVTLSGSYILANGGNAPATALTLLGGLVQPLLDWGERRAEVARNKALYQEQLAAFSQLYLEAVEDVDTTLYQITKQREYLERLRARRDILQATLDKTSAVYKEGLSDYLPVLSALQDLRAVERSVVEEERDLALLHIQLYRALGGQMPSNDRKDRDLITK